MQNDEWGRRNFAAIVLLLWLISDLQPLTSDLSSLAYYRELWAGLQLLFLATVLAHAERETQREWEIF